MGLAQLWNPFSYFLFFLLEAVFVKKESEAKSSRGSKTTQLVQPELDPGSSMPRLVPSLLHCIHSPGYVQKSLLYTQLWVPATIKDRKDVYVN